MATQWFFWVVAALVTGLVVACAALALAAARGAWRRDLDLGGVRGFYPRSVLRLRGTAAVIAGGLIATAVGTYAAVISLGLIGAIGNWL